MRFHEDEEVEDDEPAFLEVEDGGEHIKPASSPVTKLAHGRSSHVPSAATAQKQTKRRNKCAGDVPVVPITRYFAAASPAAAAAARAK